MSKASDKQIAREKRKDVVRLEEGGTQAATQIGIGVIRAARKALTNGQSGKSIMLKFSQEMHDALVKNMVASHVMGIYRIRQNVKTQTGLELGKTDTTLKWLRQRLSLTPKEWAEIEKIYGPVATQVMNPFLDMQAEAIDEAINTAIKAGASGADGLKLVNEAMTGVNGIPTSANLAETIFITQTNLAYSAGQQAQLQDPAIQEIHWGYKYVTRGFNVRDEHAAWEGVTLPKDDPFWIDHIPPNGWKCYCDVIDLYEEREIKEAPATYTPTEGPNKGVEIIPEVAEGFRFNPGTARNVPTPGKT